MRTLGPAGRLNRRRCFLSRRGDGRGQKTMNLFFGFGKDRPVTVCTDVRDYLADDRKHHYRDGRSMAEASKCWCAANGSLPKSIAETVGNGELYAAHFEYP